MIYWNELFFVGIYNPSFICEISVNFEIRDQSHQTASASEMSKCYSLILNIWKVLYSAPSTVYCRLVEFRHRNMLRINLALTINRPIQKENRIPFLHSPSVNVRFECGAQ